MSLPHCAGQWRSQNAEKDTHIKRRLLDQAVILFNRLPFQIDIFLKEFAPRGSEFFTLGANSFLKERFHYKNKYFTLKGPRCEKTCLLGYGLSNTQHAQLQRLARIMKFA